MIFGLFRIGGYTMQVNGFKPGSNITIVNTYYKRFKNEAGKMKE